MDKNKEAWKKIQENQHRNGNHNRPQKPQGKDEQRKEKRPNFLIYNGRIAMRFYSKLVQEALLALMLVAPLWGYFKLTHTDSITISTDLPTLLGIAFLTFLLQSFMFGKA